MSAPGLTRLFPEPQQQVDLQGLYLQHDLSRSEQQGPLVYSNFIASLDGRIALADPETGKLGMPQQVTNQRDWRLYQELAAQADAILVSPGYVRKLAAQRAQQHMLPLSDAPEFADLHAWRRARAMPPQPAAVVLSVNLELPNQPLREVLERPVYVATGRQADPERIEAIRDCGDRVLLVGPQRHVDGNELIRALADEGLRSIYSVAGPAVMATLIEAGVLDRLYLTQVNRVLGGSSYASFMEGSLLKQPADFTLRELYYDRGLDNGGSQILGVYDKKPKGSE